MDMHSIGDLAAETGVKMPTIRYYESIGLLDPPARTAGNQRRYDDAAMARLRFIAHARAMGFPMESLKAMLRLSRHQEAPCTDLDRLVRERLDEVDQRIAQLGRLRSELSAMLRSDAHGTVADCRILEVLSDHGACSGEH